MKKDSKILATRILELVGGKTNIKSFTNCYTRLRIAVKDVNLVKKEEIKTLEHVMGLVVANNEFQIVLGPGFVRQVREEFSKVSGLESAMEVDENVDSLGKEKDLNAIAKEVKDSYKQTQTSGIQVFLAKFSKIFTPLIYGYIGAGILAGVAGILQSAYQVPVFDPTTGLPTGNTVWTNEIAYQWYQFLNLAFNLWKDAALLMVGWKTAEVFGGTGATGLFAASFFTVGLASVYTAPFVEYNVGTADYTMQFLGITIVDPLNNWLTIGFRPTVTYLDPSNPSVSTITNTTLSYASGNMLGAMMAAGFSVQIEKMIRGKLRIPNILDMVLTSTLAFFCVTWFNYFLMIPVSGILFEWMAIAFEALYGNPWGAAFLAGTFLIAVVFGVHQGFVPVYAALISTTGLNGLFPILAMGGAGQVGAALAIYHKADKNSNIRRIVSGAIIPGFLGIGEPLIYGVTLPRVKPFITAAFGGAVAGFYLGALNSWFGITVGLNSQFGPSGLLAIPMMTASINGSALNGIQYAGLGMGLYTSGLVIGYASGYGITRMFGLKGVDLK